MDDGSGEDECNDKMSIWHLHRPV